MIYKAFIRFLKTEKKFNSYKENINKSLISIQYIQNPQYWIARTFDWADTTEGFTFWNRIHVKWMLLYRAIKNNV